jgi:hypothetical protein
MAQQVGHHVVSATRWLLTRVNAEIPRPGNEPVEPRLAVGGHLGGGRRGPRPAHPRRSGAPWTAVSPGRHPVGAHRH